MNPLIVVENPRRWSFHLEGAEVVSARAYLTEERFSRLRRAAIYNLCRRYGYQTVGYYVSLLATARGHRPLPSVATLQSLGEGTPVRTVSHDLDALIQRSLKPIKGDAFSLSIYFGRNLAERHGTLARALFNEFPAPLLRARFIRSDGVWNLVSVRPVPTSEIPEDHRDFVEEQARRYFRRPVEVKKEAEYRYEMAILWEEDDPEAPSDERAIRKFIQAARAVGIRAWIIGPDEAARVAEYDALFLRQTTAVEHHTFRMALRAAREGMVVMDDPESIIRCSNKVYQAELFRRHRIPCPETLVLHEGNVDEVESRVGFPCVVKRPDGSFSRGVVKVEDRAALDQILPDLLQESELLVAQTWAPSSFDWRIGVLDDSALYACRYHMAPGHWQIIRDAGRGASRYGKVEPVPLAEVEPGIVELAVRAAGLIGSGLYGVDVKVVEGRSLVMEVNDNPNVEAGYEDGVLQDELYLAVMRHFRRRLDARGRERDEEGPDLEGP
jgi:glutathione synthase/RimK-type ligase-like ATP-grasp enzyme